MYNGQPVSDSEATLILARFFEDAFAPGMETAKRANETLVQTIGDRTADIFLGSGSYRFKEDGTGFQHGKERGSWSLDKTWELRDFNLNDDSPNRGIGVFFQVEATGGGVESGLPSGCRRLLEVSQSLRYVDPSTNTDLRFAHSWQDDRTDRTDARFLKKEIGNSYTPSSFIDAYNERASAVRRKPFEPLLQLAASNFESLSKLAFTQSRVRAGAQRLNL